MNWAKIGHKMQSVPRQALYTLLLAVASVPLFFRLEVPNAPDQSTMDLFVALNTVPEEKPILVQSDWTLSTRGESMGQMEALLRILMRRNVKFVLYSGADPQAPQVARNVIARLNRERTAAGLKPYEKWNDWVDAGFYPNLDGLANAMAIDVRRAFAGRQDTAPDGSQRDIFESPVLEDVRNIGDFALLVNIHASGTIDILNERLYRKVPLASMCTGVMGPQSMPYYASGQLVGISVGLKGVYDLEYMMQYGLVGKAITENKPTPKAAVSGNHPEIRLEPFTGMKNFDRAAAYYFSLHFAMTLMILAIILGNLGMFLVRRAGAKGGK